jgi:hypothetical protein
MTSETNNVTEQSRAPSQERRLQQRMVVRTCGTKDVEEKTRWVVEWWSSALNHWHSTQGYASRADAELRLKNFREEAPGVWMRLVEVVERRKIVEEHKASSHNDTPNNPCKE